MTLIEIAIGTSIAGVFILIALQVSKINSQAKTQAMNQGEMEMEVAQLTRHLVQIGRLADSCKKVTLSSPDGIALECRVDFSSPPSGIPTYIQFVKFANEKAIRYRTRPNEIAAWKEGLTYGARPTWEISNFQLCNTAEMQASALGGANKCALSETPLHAWVDKLLKSGSIRLPNRYYRFEVQATKAVANHTTKGAPLLFRGGFFVRNPTHVSELVYQWGVKNGIPSTNP